VANKHKGEIEFEAGGKTYKLSFSANAMCELEDVIGMDIDALIKKFNDKEPIRLAVMRKIFWQGLLDHQPDMSLDDTKLVLKNLNPPDMARLIGEAVMASMPAVPTDDKKLAEGQGEANPPAPDVPAAELTGTTS
jgi:hypothetical protein